MSETEAVEIRRKAFKQKSLFESITEDDVEKYKEAFSVGQRLYFPSFRFYLFVLTDNRQELQREDQLSRGGGAPEGPGSATSN